jgi:predicted AAA+ superfamily ATPase
MTINYNDNGYMPRIADEVLKTKLQALPAIFIAGPKWCGKTSTAKMLCKSVLAMDDPDTVENFLKIADIRPSVLLEGEQPRLLDEWQVAPKLWDSVRHAVDRTFGLVGQYVLTGSATVQDGLTKHSGAGRIGRMIMRPMSLFESNESTGTVSLGNLFDSPEDIEGYTPLTLERLAFALCRGGWPATIGKPDGVALTQVNDYINLICNSDVSRIDGVSRNPDRVFALMRSLARNVSSQANYSSIRQDMRGDAEDLSETTISDYINALTKIYFIENLPAWGPSLRSKTPLRTSPTRHFVDPSIAANLLKIDHNGIFKDFNTFGLLFESLVVRDLRVYADTINGEVFHYRDKMGLEVDTIVHLRNGRWGAIEVKMGDAEIEKAASNLLKVKKIINTEEMNEPSFLAVVTASNYAYRRKDGVYIIPIGCLKN